jgi:hypothetical protein
VGAVAAGQGPGRFQLASKIGWDAFVNTAAREPLE